MVPPVAVVVAAALAWRHVVNLSSPERRQVVGPPGGKGNARHKAILIRVELR